MLRAELTGASQVALPAIQVLRLQPEHQVEVHVVKAGRPSRAVGGDRLASIVDSVEQPKLAVVEALHADAKPVDAEVAQGREVLAAYGAGVRFQADFRAR